MAQAFVAYQPQIEQIAFIGGAVRMPEIQWHAGIAPYAFEIHS